MFIMYRNIVVKSRLNSRQVLTPICQGKLYHSKSGVYGYRPVPRENFKLSETDLRSRNTQCNVYRWIEAYRKHGHRIAFINPVNFNKEKEYIPELDQTYYGINAEDNINLSGILNTNDKNVSVDKLENILRSIYCGEISAEFAYLESEEEREWISSRYESLIEETVSDNVKKEVAELLIKCQTFDNFLAIKFPTVKRYGGEGAENILAFFRQLFESSVDANLDHIVLGMPHRGRGNLLVTMLNVRPVKMFKKYRGGSEFPNDIAVMGDIVSHYNASSTLEIDGKSLRISMLRNPSHLEAVNPVSMGKTRSKQQSARDGAFSDDKQKRFATSVLNIQLHGDAAFSGQGINQECLMTANVPHFEIGGTIHMVVNNQVGFTTPGDRGRSSRYTTDLAKSILAPVFHVNGDNPEAVTLVTKLAFDFQREFRKDVFIDLNCFRRWGHNELDDPTFTNPLLYDIIHNRKSVPDLYVEKLIEEKILTKEHAESTKNSYMAYLTSELEAVNSYEPEPSYFQKQWSGFKLAPNSITYWDTGLDYSLLQHIGRMSVTYPSSFKIHPHLLKTHVTNRLKKLEEGNKIDWATAEALAFGSLMYQGHNVRLSGEDVGRGTFSHRHAMLVDQETNEMFIPLNELKGGHGGKLEVANSILSEEAVLGYEYGMAIDNPDNLIVWEAQFGDFFNGAQIIIDTFIVSGETKWIESNGLVMLLPHGYDGAASEHSSCRVERFLQLTNSKENGPDGDDVNLHVINPTTPAQYYHALRRQIIRDFRKPLIVVAPKTLLRLSDATSSHREFQPGEHFKNVIGDTLCDPSKVKKVILCSGKHYYNLNTVRLEKNIEDCAIVRLESLCPFPLHELQEEFKHYKGAKKFIWAQEEARNMGPWSFIKPRFEYLLGMPLEYVGRKEGATVATGDGNCHRKEVEEILEKPFN